VGREESDEYSAKKGQLVAKVVDECYKTWRGAKTSPEDPSMQSSVDARSGPRFQRDGSTTRSGVHKAETSAV
jgi:hypothetical protein